MIEEKYIDLIQQEIDKRNSAGETAELQKLLQTNVEVRQLYEDLLKMSNLMDTAEDVEPPSTLKSSIMSQINFPSRQKSRGPAFVRQIAEFIETRSSFQYAYVFAAGLIVGVALYSLVAVHPATSSAVDPESVSGTIILGTSTAPLTVGQSFHTKDNKTAVSLIGQTKFSKNVATIDFIIDSNRPVNIAVNFDAKALTFSGYSQSQGALGERRVADGVFQITNQGKNHFVLVFERRSSDPSEIVVKADESGSVIFEKTVAVGIPESDSRNR
jgi:hypothetical protein